MGEFLFICVHLHVLEETEITLLRTDQGISQQRRQTDTHTRADHSSQAGKRAGIH